MKCMFWDFSLNEWSPKGCRVLINNSNRSHTVCKCDHLSVFTAILDKRFRVIDNLTERGLEIGTFIISTITLAITIIFLTKRQKLLMKYGKVAKSKVPNRGESMKKIDAIILNQIICILTTNFIVTFGLNRTHEQDSTQDVRH